MERLRDGTLIPDPIPSEWIGGTCLSAAYFSRNFSHDEGIKRIIATSKRRGKQRLRTKPRR